jgi:hypothetical protein
MSYDDSYKAHVREYLAGAERALTRGDAVSASKEIVEALKHCVSGVRELGGHDPAGYGPDQEEIAKELAKLPPSLLRTAVRFLDEWRG